MITSFCAEVVFVRSIVWAGQKEKDPLTSLNHPVYIFILSIFSSCIYFHHVYIFILYIFSSCLYFHDHPVYIFIVSIFSLYLYFQRVYIFILFIFFEPLVYTTIEICIVPCALKALLSNRIKESIFHQVKMMLITGMRRNVFCTGLCPKLKQNLAPSWHLSSIISCAFGPCASL